MSEGNPKCVLSPAGARSEVTPNDVRHAHCVARMKQQPRISTGYLGAFVAQSYEEILSGRISPGKGRHEGGVRKKLVDRLVQRLLHERRQIIHVSENSWTYASLRVVGRH